MGSMPRNSRWVMRPAAEADLSDIWRHRAATWGIEQAQRSADGLFAVCDLLAEFPELSREREEFTPPMRFHPCGSHLVIYRLEGQGVEIIRILHSHQNLTTYLLER